MVFKIKKKITMQSFLKKLAFRLHTHLNKISILFLVYSIFNCFNFFTSQILLSSLQVLLLSAQHLSGSALERCCVELVPGLGGASLEGCVAVLRQYCQPATPDGRPNPHTVLLLDKVSSRGFTTVVRCLTLFY